MNRSFDRLSRCITAFLCFVAFFSFNNAFAQHDINYVYHAGPTDVSAVGCDAIPYSTGVPDNTQDITLGIKVEYQFSANHVSLYYTTDSTDPSGALGVPSGTSVAVAGSFSCVFDYNGNIDVWTATIPAQAAGTYVRYIVSAYDSDDNHEVFANSGDCAGCGAIHHYGSATNYGYRVGLENPSAPVLDPASDTHVLGDDTTSSVFPSFIGTATPLSTVKLYDSGNQIKDALTDSLGNYKITIDYPSLANIVTFSYSVKAEMNGVESDFSDEYIWTYDPHYVDLVMTASPTTTVFVGDTFTVDIVAETEYYVQWVALALDYDPSKLSVISLSPSTEYFDTFGSAPYESPYFDNLTGRIDFMGFKYVDPYNFELDSLTKSDFPVVTIKFQALALGSEVTITHDLIGDLFGEMTYVGIDLSQNFLRSANNLSINIVDCIPEPEIFDGIDNDCDGLIDCEDPDYVDEEPPVFTKCASDTIILATTGCGAVMPNYLSGLGARYISEDQFISMQNAHWWSYGQFQDGNTNAFSLLLGYSSSIGWYNLFGGEILDLPRVDSTGGHPSFTDDWAVRRWKSYRAGLAKFSGNFFDRDTTCGDGVNVFIYQNGVEVFQAFVNSSTIVGYEFTLMLEAGDVIDYAIDPIGDAACDDTHFTAIISNAILEALDNCGSVNYTQHPAAGSSLVLGTNVVTITASDNYGNSANCNFNIDVIDNQPPVIACANGGTRDANATNGTYMVSGNEFDPTSVSDNCTYTLSHNAGGISGSIPGASTESLAGWQLPIGTHSIEFTVTDAGNNSQSCIVEVEVLLTAEISGTVALNTSCTPMDMRVKVFETGTENQVGADIITTIDAAGNYTIDISQIPSGIYDVALKPLNYLQKKFTAVDFSNGQVNIDLSYLSPGDIAISDGGPFGNNMVNAVDLSLFLTAYNQPALDGQGSPNSAYIPSADLNCDGFIDGFDISIMLYFFGVTGE